MKLKNPAYYIKIFILVVLIISFFTLLDFLVHNLSNSFAVPEYYFRNKIIVGIIYGFIISLFTAKMKPLKRAITFSAIIAVLLQVRYYFEGYAKWFVFLFLGLHFLMLFLSSWIAFKISEKYKLVK